MNEPPLRIAILIGRFPQLSETFIFRKVLALAARGHRIDVLTRRSGDWDEFREALPLPANVRVHRLPPDSGVLDPREVVRGAWGVVRSAAGYPSRAWSLGPECRTSALTRSNPFRHWLRHLPLDGRDIDVYHCEFLAVGSMYPLLFGKSGPPVVVSCRGADLHLHEQRSPEERELYLHALRAADAVHCVSDEMRELALRLSGRTERVHVNRPAVDTSIIVPLADRRPSDPPTIVAVGRLVWKKAFDYLLEAVRRLKREGSAFRLRIVGGGPLEASLRYAVRDLELTDEVELLGSRSPAKTIEIIRAADICALASHEEGISNAVLEAMASGVPIVSTDAGGMREAVRDGREGFIVPVREPRPLADKLRLLLNDPALRTRLGQAARERAVAEFSIDRQAERFEAIYREAIAHRRGLGMATT